MGKEKDIDEIYMNITTLEFMKRAFSRSESLADDVKEIDITLAKLYEENPPIIKFNGGRNALLCSKCNSIIDEDFDRDKYKHLELCDNCKML